MAVLALAMTGCADPCAKLEECAKKAGTSFSITECRTAATAERERVNTKGCSAEYGAFESCVTGLTCDQLNSSTGVTTNCGAQAEKTNKCLN